MRGRAGPVEIKSVSGYETARPGTLKATRSTTMDFLFFISGIFLIGIALFFLKQSAIQGD